MSEPVRVGRRTVDVSNPGKTLFPEDGVTKSDLVGYYRTVATTAIRHLRGRPVVMQRFPEGIGEGGFYHKDVPEHFPDWIRRVELPKKEGGTITHAVCDEPACLAYLADQACITPHVWLARADRLDTPDRMIFDLDPAGDDLALLRRAARSVGDLLTELGLVPYLMTTGSRGYHVVAPLRRGSDFDDVRDVAREAAELLASRDSDRLTVEQRKDQRGDRIFLDYLRNAYAQTSVAPYAVRAKPGAPVATPLRWEELDEVEPAAFSIDGVPGRLERDGDPWAGINRRARSIPAPRRKLRRMRETGRSGG